nr:hypothetical protein [Acinetobacter sp. Marseille-Q1623]
MVDIYGKKAKEVLNVSRDYWNFEFENKHADFLKELFEKHISKIKTLETDLLKLTYCVDYNIDFELSKEWEGYTINGYKIEEILIKDGFYILDGSENFKIKKDHLKAYFNDYIFLESIEDRDDLLLCTLNNFCNINGYKIYSLRLSEELHRYPEYVGLKFYSKFIMPLNKDKEFLWVQTDIYNTNEEKNIYELLWDEMLRNYNIQDSLFRINYLNKHDDKLDLLKKFDKLFFKHTEYWDDLGILSPYQNIDNNIKFLNLDKLSAYVANRKNDLVNVKEYKDLYQKLIVEIDKYKKTPL